MRFAENLVRLQGEHMETNYRLAKVLGVHPSTIQNWRDGRSPSLELLGRVARHYGTTVEALLGRVETVNEADSI